MAAQVPRRVPSGHAWPWPLSFPRLQELERSAQVQATPQLQRTRDIQWCLALGPGLFGSKHGPWQLDVTVLILVWVSIIGIRDTAGDVVCSQYTCRAITIQAAPLLTASTAASSIREHLLSGLSPAMGLSLIYPRTRISDHALHSDTQPQ